MCVMLCGPHVVQAAQCQPIEQEDGGSSTRGQLVAAAHGPAGASPEKQHEDMKVSQL